MTYFLCNEALNVSLRVIRFVRSGPRVARKETNFSEFLSNSRRSGIKMNKILFLHGLTSSGRCEIADTLKAEFEGAAEITPLSTL